MSADLEPVAQTATQPALDAVLLPYQQAWVADRSAVKVVEKSRRVGLSWAEAALSVLEAAKVEGQDTWYLGYSQDMAREFVRDCAAWARSFGLAADAMGEMLVADEGQDILAFQIKFASGKRITALSSSPRNLRGKQGRVVIDEAAFHPDLPELLKSAFALLIWGGSVSIISTHFGADNPFNELVQDVREGKKPYSLHRIPFADALDQGLFERICLSTKRPWSRQAQADWEEEIRAIYRPNDAEELDCIPSNSTGAYMSRALIEQRMRDAVAVLRYACPNGFEELPESARKADAQAFIDEQLLPALALIPRSARSSVGVDFGRSGDLSVFWVLFEAQGLQQETPFTVELRNVPFQQQEQILFALCDQAPRFNHAALDARGNGQYLAEVMMQRYGSASVSQVMLTAAFYLEHFPRLKAALEDGSVASLPKDAEILQDLRLVTVIKGVPRVPEQRTSGANGGQRHGDAAVALLLAHVASRQGGGVYEFRLLPVRGLAALGDELQFESRRDL